MMTLLLACFVVLLLIVFRKKGKPLPPGPWGLPVVGYAPFLNPMYPMKTLHNLVKKYGSVFSFKLGEKTVVIISDYKILRKVYGMAEFGGRPDSEIGHSVTFDKPIGLVNSSMGRSVFHRRFVLRHLKDFGVGKSEFDPILYKYANRLIELFRKNINNPKILLEFCLETSVMSILWNIMLGSDFRLDDEIAMTTFKHKLKSVEDYCKIFFVGTLNPVLARWVPKSWYTLDKLQEASNIFKMYAAVLCESLKQDPGSLNPEVLADHYLLEMSECESRGQQTNFSDEDLLCCLTDLYVAGTETTAETLRYALIYLIRNPNWQLELQKEVDRVIGRKRAPRTEDKAKMPVLQAFIYETLRCSTLTPLGIYHMTETDVQLNEYFIPKGAIVLGHLEYIHFDPDVFEDPQKFNPSRFLDSNGNFLKHPAILSFLPGKRRCLGEYLANIELFFFLSTFIQNFIFKPSPGEEIPADKRVIGQLAKPYPFTFSLEDRLTSEDTQNRRSLA